ncbi:hypothetical protein [uncultured Veillonella sp.]|uniref:hypothetical protein n=1 Tax=uncultured Veillonella sp. TaxID=159268 RepID=UPI0026172EEB|nr:hypothetical protein [uncultured Veillonella sp.]
MDMFDTYDALDGLHEDGLYSSIPTGTGLHTIMHGGTIVDTLTQLGTEVGDFVMPNVDGGFDVYEEGLLAAHTKPNVFGGTEVYDDAMSLDHFSMPNMDGGVDFYDTTMDHLGHTMDNVFGGSDLIIDSGNVSDLLDMQDPLRHAGSLKLPTFKL